MDALTSDFYDRYADSLVQAPEAPRSAMWTHIERVLKPRSSVLDVGAGSGRDVLAMLALGLDAFGVEPHEAMRTLALIRHPELQGRLRAGLLPELARPFADLRPQGFDAVVCSAVLMHLSAEELPQALAALARQLHDGPAVMLMSLPAMEAGRLAGDRDGDGRRFHNHSPDGVQRVVKRLGFESVQCTTSEMVLASTGTRWHTLVCERD